MAKIKTLWINDVPMRVRADMPMACYKTKSDPFKRKSGRPFNVRPRNRWKNKFTKRSNWDVDRIN